MKSVARMVLLSVLALAAGTAIAQKKNKSICLPIPERPREFVPPEQVGLPPNCPFPAVKERITFVCPRCGLKMETHMLYPHLPHCPRDDSVMFEKGTFPEKPKRSGNNNITQEERQCSSSRRASARFRKASTSAGASGTPG